MNFLGVRLSFSVFYNSCYSEALIDLLCFSYLIYSLKLCNRWLVVEQKGPHTTAGYWERRVWRQVHLTNNRIYFIAPAEHTLFCVFRRACSFSSEETCSLNQATGCSLVSNMQKKTDLCWSVRNTVCAADHQFALLFNSKMFPLWLIKINNS